MRRRCLLSAGSLMENTGQLATSDYPNMLKQFPNYINGEWVMGSSWTTNRNPSDLSDVIGEYAAADVAQTTAAVAAARGAFTAWSVSSIQDRANMLDKVGSDILARKDELGRLLAREEGKTLPEGVGETMRAGHIFKFFAGEALRLSGEKLPSVRPGVEVEITREPIGVISCHLLYLLHCSSLQKHRVLF